MIICFADLIDALNVVLSLSEHARIWSVHSLLPLRQGVGLWLGTLELAVDAPHGWTVQLGGSEVRTGRGRLRRVQQLPKICEMEEIVAVMQKID